MFSALNENIRRETYTVPFPAWFKNHVTLKNKIMFLSLSQNSVKLTIFRTINQKNLNSLSTRINLKV